ncbi:MAG: hypothetical protein WBV69_16285 [Candidatus Sulfotelmatobacter sp.]
MDEETLTMLLRGEHLSLPDRIARGSWPHPPLRFSQVLAHLTKLLDQHKWFPREWKPYRVGEPVQEGGTIEHQGRDRYVYRAARAHPIQPRALAESTERVFSSAEDAARYFLKWDLHLPGDIDGWKVIE